MVSRVGVKVNRVGVRVSRIRVSRIGGWFMVRVGRVRVTL